MKRLILASVVVVAFGVFCSGTARTVSAQSSPGGDDLQFGEQGYQEFLGVQIPDQGSILIGGILASPEVYAWFIPESGSVILQAAGAGQAIMELGDVLALVMAIDRPINDADNRPDAFWIEMIESLFR